MLRSLRPRFTDFPEMNDSLCFLQGEITAFWRTFLPGFGFLREIHFLRVG